MIASLLLGSMLAGNACALGGYDYGDWYDPYGVDTDDDYYSDGTGTFYLYADSGYTPEAPEPIGGIPPCYYTNTCEDNPSQNSDNPSENSDSDLIDQVVDSLDGFGGRRLQQDNYGDWYDPYGVDPDDDYYSDGTGTFYAYPDSGYIPGEPDDYSEIEDYYYDTYGGIIENTHCEDFHDSYTCSGK